MTAIVPSKKQVVTIIARIEGTPFFFFLAGTPPLPPSPNENKGAGEAVSLVSNDDASSTVSQSYVWVGVLSVMIEDVVVVGFMIYSVYYRRQRLEIQRHKNQTNRKTNEREKIQKPIA